MKSSKTALKRKSGNILKPARSARTKARIGVESLDEFFSRARANARKLDRRKPLEAGLRISFEDPADFLGIITPARIRLLRYIAKEPMLMSALATALIRDPAAVRRDVAVLESKRLVKTRKVANPGHGVKTFVERAAASIELAATV